MRLFAAFTFLIGSTAIACADSLWDHNGSIMHLQQDGDRRFIYYAQPRQGMVEAGVTPGTLFFDGIRQGDELIGTARVFSSKCPAPMTFSISGPIHNDGRIVLEGVRPVFKNCQATGEMKLDRLEFIFIENFVPEFDEISTPTVDEPEGDGFAVDGAQSEPATSSESVVTVDVAALLKSGLAGDAASYRALSGAFAYGRGVIASEERSLFFLKKAGELGDTVAQQEWAQAIKSQHSPNPEDIAQAEIWLGAKDADAPLNENDDVSSVDSGVAGSGSTSGIAGCGRMCDMEWLKNARHQEIIQEVRRIENVNGKTKEGWTALGYAAGWGKLEAVRILLGRGADPLHTDENGESPLDYALFGGHAYEAFLLILAGADLYELDKEGRSVRDFASDFAASRGESRLLAFLDAAKFIQTSGSARFDMNPEHTVKVWSEFGFDHTLDMEMLHGRASLGDPNAAIYLSLAYANGIVQSQYDLSVDYARLAERAGHPLAADLLSKVQALADAETLQREAELRETLRLADSRMKIGDNGRVIPPQISSGIWLDRQADITTGRMRKVQAEYGDAFKCTTVIEPVLLERLFQIALAGAARLGVNPPKKELCHLVQQNLNPSIYPPDIITFYSEEKPFLDCLNHDWLRSLAYSNPVEANRQCGNAFVFTYNNVIHFSIFSSSIGLPDDYGNDYEECYSPFVEKLGEMVVPSVDSNYNPMIRPSKGPNVKHMLGSVDGGACPG